jgi:hypothetical protein
MRLTATSWSTRATWAIYARFRRCHIAICRIGPTQSRLPTMRRQVAMACVRSRRLATSLRVASPMEMLAMVCIAARVHRLGPSHYQVAEVRRPHTALEPTALIPEIPRLQEAGAINLRGAWEWAVAANRRHPDHNLPSTVPIGVSLVREETRLPRIARSIPSIRL